MPGGGVAYGVVGDGVAVIGGEQVLPLGVPIGVGVGAAAVRVGDAAQVPQLVVAQADAPPLGVGDGGDVPRLVVFIAGAAAVYAKLHKAARLVVDVGSLRTGGVRLGDKPARQVIGKAGAASLRPHYLRHLAHLIIAHFCALFNLR